MVIIYKLIYFGSQYHPPSATDSGRTARTPLYPSVHAVPPYHLPLFSPVPDRRALQQLALNVHVKHSDPT